jgi:ribosomal protein S16
VTGTYNPHANKHGEKVITLNYERIKHWLVVGAQPTVRLLGALCMRAHAHGPAPQTS